MKLISDPAFVVVAAQKTWTDPLYQMCELQQRRAILVLLFSLSFLFFFQPIRIYSRMLICARCTANPLAWSPLRASNSAFNYSQPEARHQHPSSFIRTGSCAPNSVPLQSSCNPTLKLPASRHLRLVLFSSPLLHTFFVSLHLCMAASS